MQRDLEIAVQNIHDAYGDESAFYWLRSFVTLVGTAQYMADRPGTHTLETLMQACSEQQQDALYFRAPMDTAITRDHCWEWVLKAGEIRLMLHAEWRGDWDELGIMEACRLYAGAMREGRPIVIQQR